MIHQFLLAVKCVLNVNVIYCHKSATVQEKTSLPALNNIIKPYESVLCNDRICKAHHSEISEYHDAVIMSMIDACRETIFATKPASKCKTVPGWNDYVKGYFDTLLFWHNM